VAAQKDLLGYIAETNVQEGRTWTMNSNDDGRDVDADSWGAFKYLVNSQDPSIDTTNMLTAIMKDGQTKLNTMTLGLAFINSDPSLKAIYGSGDPKQGCSNLQKTSKNAFLQPTNGTTNSYGAGAPAE
jgi:hypothetical protein